MNANSEYTGDVCSVENQRILAKLVTRDVVHCASVMVSELARGEGLDPETEQALIDLGSRYVDNELFDFTTRDALEHWIVSKSLGLKLGQRGEIVRKFFDFTIWGRTTSGQSISIDSVIVEIALEMEILTGQKYDWSK